MAEAPSAYPLQWPAGWPRTAARERWPAKVTLSAALGDLEREMRLLGVKEIVLSSNCSLGMENAPDPAVVAYGVYGGQPIAIPCDRWTTVAANVRAIAKTIEAMRGMERWGAKHMIRAMFQGFTALPAATAGQVDWRAVMKFKPGTRPTVEEIRERHRALAREAHPDAGGSTERMTALNVARDQGVKEVSGG